MRLIDADALHTLLAKKKDFGELSAKKAIRCVEEAPTVDAVPVRHGKWISNSPVTMRCNQCTYVASDWIVHKFYYCPNCGARMDEE